MSLSNLHATLSPQLRPLPGLIHPQEEASSQPLAARPADKLGTSRARSSLGRLFSSPSSDGAPSTPATPLSTVHLAVQQGCLSTRAPLIVFPNKVCGESAFGCGTLLVAREDDVARENDVRTLFVARENDRAVAFTKSCLGLPNRSWPHGMRANSTSQDTSLSASWRSVVPLSPIPWDERSCQKPPFGTCLYRTP
ncbi:hypothetical protein MRX96_012154 [Rhipicephalus microplus]